MAPIILGYKQLGEIRFGDREIKEGYVGNILVYDSGGGAPGVFMESIDPEGFKFYTKRLSSYDRFYQNLHSAGYTDTYYYDPGYKGCYGASGHTANISPCGASVKITGLDIKGYSRLIIEGLLPRFGMDGINGATRVVRVRDGVYETDWGDPNYYYLQNSDDDRWIKELQNGISTFKIVHDLSNSKNGYAKPTSVDIDIEVKFDTDDQVNQANMWLVAALTSLRAEK